MLKLLSKEDMDKIHRATVKVLEKTGVKFIHDEALNILEKNGALVDRKTKIAKIPEAVFDEFRKKAPNEFPLFNRNGKRVPIAKDDFFIETFGDGTYFTDRDGTQRPSTLKDIEKIMIVGDALENVNGAWVGSMPTDLHPNVQMIHSLAVEINNSPTKPVTLFGENEDQMRYAIRIGAALLGGMEELKKTPPIIGGGWATSPLVHANEILDSQIIAAKEGFPTACGSMATSITTAPATLAGTLVVWNAEVMSSLVLSQMIAPGVPFEVQCSGSAADPRRGYYPVGNPEMALVNAGCMELSYYYDLPCLIAGCQADAKIVDPQAAIEKTITTVIPAMVTKGKMIYGMGMLDSGMSMSLEQYVIDNEIVAAVRHSIKGIEVTDETIDLDTIIRVGPGGHFMSQESTRKRIRTAVWIPELFTRDYRTDWEKKGWKDLFKKACEKVDDILAHHKPEPLDRDIAKDIRSIVKEADKELTKTS